MVILGDRLMRKNIKLGVGLLTVLATPIVINTVLMATRYKQQVVGYKVEVHGTIIMLRGKW